MDIIERIQSSIVGHRRAITTPFGTRPLVYADYTASGRGLTFIEDFIRDQVLPFYANTHTEASLTGEQTTAFREQARAAIRRSVNAKEDDLVIFAGAGATAAIDKLIRLLGLAGPQPADDRPVVFIGPYEHHSNELHWRELDIDLEVVGLTASGQIDLNDLEARLAKYSGRTRKFGSFSAASNVTGVKSPVKAIAALLHRYDAKAFFDYAGAAPYVGIDMSGENGEHLDGIYISPHKFIGGPGTPGILVVNEACYHLNRPTIPGGGTVSFVAADYHKYLGKGEAREEGGTPAIIESIRAGLVFDLKDRVGAERIEALEEARIAQAFARWSQHPNIHILGGIDNPRVGIVSMRIKHQGRDLHFGYVVSLLNDLFGIQVRGGCSCAGPYGHELLEIDDELSVQFREQNDQGNGIVRPGWVRLNFNYFIPDDEFDYLVSAIELIATHGWRLLDHYSYDRSSNTWKCRDFGGRQLLSLQNYLDAPVEASVCNTPYHELLSAASNQFIS